MNDISEKTEIIQQLALLYELSLAAAASLNFQENCEIFIAKLMTRQELAFAAVWIRNDALPYAEENGAALRYARPRDEVQIKNLPHAHPMLTRLGSKSFLAIPASDPDFADLSFFAAITEPLIVLFALERIGVLQLVYAPSGSAPQNEELAHLTPVIDLFARVLKGALQQEQAQLQIGEYRRFTARLQRAKDDLDQQLLDRLEKIKRAQKAFRRRELAHKDRLAGLNHDFRTPLGVILSLAGSLQEGIYGPLTDRQRESVRKIEKSGRILLSLVEEGLNIDKQYGPALVGSKRRVTAAAEQFPSSRRTILLAEDDPDNALTTREYLQSHGYEILLAGNGREAVALAREKRPALILMDIQMPEMDGLQATRQIRADAALAGTPIIALTALSMAGDRERCLAAGVDEYMSKPVSLRRLAGKIAQMLADPPPAAEVTHLSSAASTLLADEQISSGPLILLVDDDETNLSVYLDVLEFNGYRSLTALSGAEALSLTREVLPDLIVMDLNMPDINGLEATRRLRADPRTAETPIILATGMSSPADEQRCLAAGASAYLAKPVRLQLFLQTISRFLEKKPPSS